MSILPIFQVKPVWTLILASSSPRRKSLLASAGLDFLIHKPDIEEPLPDIGEGPKNFAARCAHAKAQACALEIGDLRNKIILAADTIVVLNGNIIGKPENTATALETLLLLNNKAHQVFTAIQFILPDTETSHVCESKVEFNNWPVAVLKAYAESGDPLDKAGAYGIQGSGAFLIKNIDGSASNVAGLPLSEVIAQLLRYNCIEARSISL